MSSCGGRPLIMKKHADKRRKTVKRARDLKESAEMHRHIYRAVRSRDSEAARTAMRNHLTLAQKAQDAEEAADRSVLAAKPADDGQPASAVNFPSN
jgi:GntR family transcriptional repressor for pyruvate dehydrogenase complex